MPPNSNSTPPQSQDKPLIAGWRRTSAEIEASRRHVVLDIARVPELLPWLAPGPANAAWRGYVGPVDPEKPDTKRVFFELALTISQFGGFVGYQPDGAPEIWKLDGSGIKAILATMAAIRDARKLPGIDIHDDYDRELAHFFIRSPFGKQRLDILAEVGAPAARLFFDRLLELSRCRDGSYRFNVLHM